MRRVVLVPVLALSLLLAACGDDDQPSGQPSEQESDPESNPMNAVVELGRPVERGYDRTDWDPEALEAALALARRTTDTTVGCVDPGPVSFEVVKDNHQRVQLPMPAALVQCWSNGEDEDLQFSAFTDEESKQTYIEAKAELICGRAMAAEDDPETRSRFDGIVYVDAGLVIIEPDTYVVRDLLAQELQATASKMCPEAVGDAPRTIPGT